MVPVGCQTDAGGESWLFACVGESNSLTSFCSENHMVMLINAQTTDGTRSSYKVKPAVWLTLCAIMQHCQSKHSQDTMN